MDGMELDCSDCSFDSWHREAKGRLAKSLRWVARLECSYTQPAVYIRNERIELDTQDVELIEVRIYQTKQDTYGLHNRRERGYQNRRVPHNE